MAQPHARHCTIVTTSNCFTYNSFFDRGESSSGRQCVEGQPILRVLSTTSQPAATGTVLGRPKDGTRVPVSCHDNIIHYNEYMGGVDRGDQLRGYCLCRTKSRKFYKYIFYFLFDVAITNAYISYKLIHPDPSKSLLPVKDFRLQLAKELIGCYCFHRVPGRSGGVVRPLQLQHFPRKECHQTTERGAGLAGVATAPSIIAKDLCHDENPQTDCFYL